ncbi:MAG: allantoate amidohydrolase [Williamsia herbipolensis]|nr:allantoate amidohydrolase [Williamsia herbipolensis]
MDHRSTGGRDPSRFGALQSDLAGIGRDKRRGGYSRHGFDDADLALREWFRHQAQRRGLDVETDRNGNLWAWWGSGPEAVVTGSHLDSVPGGGAFDGPLGVIAALLAVDELRVRNVRPVRPLAVACFVEEEGGRFGVPCLGSRLLTGALDPDQVRRLTDPQGASMVDALRRSGIDPQHVGADPARLAGIGAFVELHVEQGRLMAQAAPDAAVAVGSGILAHGRWRLHLTGEGNHAGTTRADDRVDPMVPAAGAVLAARRAMSRHPDGVATVGRIVPNPGGTNVIASSVDVWLDARTPTPGATGAMVDDIVADVRAEAELEGCSLVVHRESLSPDVEFDPGLIARTAQLLSAPIVPTGAGHDAGVLSTNVPSSMLFVRNRSGVSHAPAEHADTDDCLAGVTALADVLEDLVR